MFAIGNLAEIQYNETMNHLITITKSDGSKQLFEEEKLINSLRHAGANDVEAEDVVEEIEKDMWEGMPTVDIYRRAFELLKRHSKHTASKYSIRRAIFELGPDGFPFERFVSRIFNIWGYETITDQTLMGTCGVDHEIDVVAWKGDELAMTEAKFHNEIALRSDLKVALYVKSRFDDLADMSFKYGDKERKLTSRWLFTNTKFTDSAIKYGECKNIHMIGWNYPKENLHTIIETHGLHPITTISALTNQQKKDLIGRDIITCTDLLRAANVLSDIGVKSEEANKVTEEVRTILGQ